MPMRMATWMTMTTLMATIEGLGSILETSVRTRMMGRTRTNSFARSSKRYSMRHSKLAYL